MLRNVSFVVVLACIAGCDEPQPTAPPPKPPPPAATGAKVGTKVEQQIDWPEASSIDHKARAALADDARAAVDRAPVPVLVVARPSLLAAAKVIAQPNFYALSAQSEGVTISLQATRIAHKYDHIPPAKGPALVRGKPAFVTQNEAIWSATWTEFGASYVLEVECNTLPDPRCTDDRFVLELAENLAYVGGAP
jgi:hypothetical protein